MLQDLHQTYPILAICVERSFRNSGLIASIAYKTSNYTWQVGPQIRIQIFSTNTKLYSVEERLQNYGFKIAVSKKL